MPKPNYKMESECLQRFLEMEASAVGQATGFVQRQSKLTRALFAQTLILSCVAEPEASLNQMVQWSDELGLELTPQALDKRMTNQAVDFLSSLLQRVITHQRRQATMPSTVLQQFSSITILDSTQVALPDCLQAQFAGSGGNAAQASIKFHLSFDYLTGQVNAVETLAGRSSDQKCSLHRQKRDVGSLHLFDLGYFEQEALEDIATAEAYFVCRLHPQVGIYETRDATHKLDLAAWVSHLSGEKHELMGFVGNKVHLPVRVLRQHLPAP